LGQRTVFDQRTAHVHGWTDRDGGIARLSSANGHTLLSRPTLPTFLWKVISSAKSWRCEAVREPSYPPVTERRNRAAAARSSASRTRVCIQFEIYPASGDNMYIASATLDDLLRHVFEKIIAKGVTVQASRGATLNSSSLGA
jgi:hypothetical protein